MKLFWLGMASLVAALALALLLGATAAPVNAGTQVAVQARVQAQDSVRAQADSGYKLSVTGRPVGLEVQGEFFGDLSITRFDSDQSTLLLIGTLDNYSYVEGGKSTIGNVRRDLALAVTSITGGCEGVTLVLQSLSLGGEFPPEIFLDPIALRDSATSGSDKRIGKLLCKVGEMAARDAKPNAIANQLNHLLRELS
jgi:hypothetical protein